MSPTPPALRLTLQGPAGAVDVLAAPGTPAGQVVSPQIADLLGVRGPTPALASRIGQPLRPDRSLELQQVQDGDRLVVLPAAGRAAAAAAAQVLPARGRAAAPGARGRSWPLVLALALLAGAAVQADLGSDLAWVVLAGAVLFAGLSLLAPSGRWGDTWRLLSPGAAGIAALVGLRLADATATPGGTALTLTAVAVSAGVVAAVQRSLDRGAREELTVQLVAALALAGLAGATQLLGAGTAALAASVVGVGSVLLRLLPSLSIDVPDSMLLEVDRVLVTAWAPARQPRRSRRRRVRQAAVRAEVASSRRLLDAAVVAIVLAVTAAALLLLGRPSAGLEHTGAQVLCALLAAALLLQARAFRDAVARGALLCGGAVCAVALVLALLDGAGGRGQVLLAALGALTGGAALLAAVALGRGWRSVRWARTGDLLEATAVALLLPATLLAGGAVDHFRSVVS